MRWWSGSGREPASSSPPYSSTLARTSITWHSGSRTMHARQAERAELVGGFVAALATVVAFVDMEDILCSGG